MMVPIPGIIEPVAPVAHPDAATPEVFAAHGAAWDIGVAASIYKFLVKQGCTTHYLKRSRTICDFGYNRSKLSKRKLFVHGKRERQTDRKRPL
jgi:hypothetical protein